MNVWRLLTMALLAAGLLFAEAASVRTQKVYVVKRGDTLGEKTDQVIPEIKTREEHFQRIGVYSFLFALTGLGIILFGVCMRRVLIDRRMAATAAAREKLHAITEPNFTNLTEPLFDPDIRTLEKFAEATKQTHCQIILPVGEYTIGCTVEIRNGNPLVHFQPTKYCRDVRPVRWNKRVPKAAEMLGCSRVAPSAKPSATSSDRTTQN